MGKQINMNNSLLFDMKRFEILPFNNSSKLENTAVDLALNFKNSFLFLFRTLIKELRRK